MEEAEVVYRAILDIIGRGESAAVATVIEARGGTPRGTSAKMLIGADGQTVGTIGGGEVEARVIKEARTVLTEGRARELIYQFIDQDSGDPGICGGEMRIFVEVILPSPILLIIGGGHVGVAVAELAAFLGYRIAVVDAKPELIVPDRFPWAERLLTGDPVQEVANLRWTEQTYVAMVTSDYRLDIQLLKELAGRPYAYIGLIGSRRRSKRTFELAREAGVPDEVLKSIHTPIGLDIGAEGPRELAVSILAEITALRRGKR